ISVLLALPLHTAYYSALHNCTAVLVHLPHIPLGTETLPTDVPSYTWCDMSAFQASTVELSELWSFEDGTSYEGTIFNAAVGADGTSVLAGQVRGDWAYGISTLTSPRSVAAKLDNDGTILWKWQDDTLRYASWAAAMDQDGSVVLAGNWMLSVDISYFAVWKLGPNGTLLWEYQDRISEKFNRVYGLAIGDDGSIYCAGTAEWESDDSGYQTTSTSDYAAFKLNKDGTLLWEEQVICEN
ncbi:unnamed protein product, partial [Ectocarpus fasciculatus]